MSWRELVLDSDAGKTARDEAESLIEAAGEECDVEDLPSLAPALLLGSSPSDLASHRSVSSKYVEE